MKRVINCKQVDDIELAFGGGESISLRFDIDAAIRLTEMADGGNKMMLTCCSCTASQGSNN